MLVLAFAALTQLSLCQKIAVDQCDNSCCEENKPQVIIERDDPCCNNVSTLVIPFNLTSLAKVPTAEIVEISTEADPVVKILKLLRLIEKCRK